MNAPAFQPGLVSIVIPTYNRADLLRQALDSALRQTYQNIQIIVVDDGSTDDTAATVAAYNGVTFISQKNAGPSAARNNGSKHAQGEYIAFLDSDDLWMPQYLESCLRGFISPDIGFVFANWQGIFEDNSLNYPDYFQKRGVLNQFQPEGASRWVILPHGRARQLFLTTSTALPSGTIVRRSAIASPWDEQLRVGEDRLFLLDIIMQSRCSIAFTQEVLWSHRLHKSNSYMGNPQIGKMAEQEIQSKERIVTKHGTALSRAEIKVLQQSIGQNYFDWAYHESTTGKKAKALELYLRSYRYFPRFKTVSAICKTLVKSARP
jgi:glycosyltransferase involved in cell wall biosynthesis